MMLSSKQITRTATSNVIAIQNATLGNLPNFLGHRLVHEVTTPCQAFTWLHHQPTPPTPGS
jgi:hypothetical protein